MTLRTLVVGLGKMGQIRVGEVQQHPGFELCAVCDIDPTRSSLFPNVAFHTDWQEALASVPEVVFVSTFNHIAPEIVCAALAQGCHVFCEKPPGRSSADVERMIAAERAAGGRLLKFGFNHRVHNAVIEAKSIVDSGRFGKLLFARGIYGKAGGVAFQESWRNRPELAGGGILLDQGIHMLDLLLLFFGTFSDVKSFVENSFWKTEPLEDNAFALLRTACGQVAMVHSSATQWKHKFNLDLFMEDGYVTINGILSSTRSYGEESITYARKQFEDSATAFGRPREETIYFDKDSSWRLEVEDFYHCIVAGKETLSGGSADALRVMQLVETIYDNGKQPEAS